MKALWFAFAMLISSPIMAFDFEKDFGFQGSSSVPPQGAPATAALPDDVTKEMPLLNVLVFPHTLSSDWLHGPPDDARQLELQSQSPFSVQSLGLNKSSNKLKLFYTNSGKIRALFADGTDVTVSKLEIRGEAPVKLHRVRNVEKSNSYLGTLTIKSDSRGIRAINHVDMETYLRGVVPKESGASWPLESLKAQALAARSYAYYHYVTAPSGRDFHVDDTARYQVYAGFSGSDPRTDVAIAETEGEIITHNGEVIVAYFHAYSGGRTDSARNIFKQSNVPYCSGNDEIFPREELSNELAPGSRWIVNWETDHFSPNALLSKFMASSSVGRRFSDFTRSAGLELEEIEFQPEFESVRTIRVFQPASAKEAQLDFAEVRSVIGYADFPGYHFRTFVENDGFVFKGSGWGHHVGLSQWGAYIMAKNYDKTYVDIIHHYYSDIAIERLPWSRN